IYSLVGIKLLANNKTKQKEQILDEEDYILKKDYIIINSRYMNRHVEIDYISGLELVPPNIIQAIKMYLLLLYDKEDIIYTKLIGIHTLLNPHRLIQI
ncbi:MAG: hypothetical protein SFT68_04605, partial [Rickettsiaceae bacterium]|nr:hypothetical protein [Rickettsiaceae bacterium]